MEGGCANDYSYGFGDPINGTDLDGQRFGISDEECRSLKGGIMRTAAELKKRYDDLVADPLKLPLYGPKMTVESHQKEFRTQQGRIKKLFKVWNWGDCGGDGRGGTLSASVKRWPTAQVPGPVLFEAGDGWEFPDLLPETL